MEFDLCTTAVFKHDKLAKIQNISLNNQTVIKNMELDENYMYLGIEESKDIDNSQMKHNLVKEYYRHVWQILKTELNSKNTITAINTLAVPVLIYSFRLVKWFRKEIEKIGQKMRKLLTIEVMHQVKAEW
jgi:hypothetical protein